MKTFHFLIVFAAFALIASIGLNSVTGEPLTNSNFPPPASPPLTYDLSNSSSPVASPPDTPSLTSPSPDSSPMIAAVPEHSNITSYAGPSTCLACHRQQAVAMFGSVHYQWTGATPNVPNIPGNAGKAELGFNTYCGSVETSRHIACYSCHAGAGLAPNQTMSEAQLSNIDCMTCHQELYRRAPAAPFENLTFTDYAGVPHTWRLPVEDAQGNFQYVINESQMPVSAVVAAQTVHSPTRTTCLSCHAYAAGSDCGKRGDLSTAMVNPPVAVDVHMSPQGANLTCQACHQFTSHRVLGRGLDIRENDVAAQLTCTSTGCHSSTPHNITQVNNHTSRVSCQACHIPEYAKLVTTEMQRNWTAPFWFPGMFSNQGGYKPEEIRQGNVTPTYAWYNGTSYVYIRGQVPPLRPDGMYEFAAPYGSVNEGQIVPMKEHTSNSAMLDSTRQMIPFSTFIFFVTGDFSRAVQAGQETLGMTGNWSMVDVHTYQTINHQVEPALNALQCGDCHAAYAGGVPTRMDLQGSLGYAPKAPLSQTCSQCHSAEDNPGFVSVHNRHLREGITCSSCHNFSRPERLGSKTMIGVYQNGVWYLDWNGNGAWDQGVDKVYSFGAAGWTSVIGDWNPAVPGTKIGVYQNGVWYLDWNGNGVWDQGIDKLYSFGSAGWTSVVGDWNPAVPGTKIGVYQNGVWYLDWNGNGVWDQGVDKVYSFGAAGWTSVVGDWNPAVPGTEIGVYQNGIWYLDWNGDGVWDGADRVYSFGTLGWAPILGNWNGDTTGIKIGVYKDGAWYLDNDGSGMWNAGDKAYYFGATGWIPETGDWNALGFSSVGVTDAQQWYLDSNGNGVWDNGIDYAYSFGARGWTPIVGKWS
jgi:hypothetical protein